jgi:addiction module HigA family antidote
MPRTAKSPQSPGTVLNIFMRGFEINPTRLAREIKMSQAAVRLLVLDKTKLSVNAALRLGKYFKVKPEYWLELQNKYDIANAVKDAKLVKDLAAIVPAKKPVKPAGRKAAAPAKKPAAARGRKPAAPAKRGPKKAAAPAKKPGRRGRKPAGAI